MIKSKKQMFIVIGAFLLVLMLGTVTYAFFNYTRIGAANTISVGRISFVSKNEETITLNNLFPIDPTEQGIMNDNTKVGTYSIDIKGDTDYVDGIEYLVSAVDTNIYTTEGQIVPITLDFTVTGLGTESVNYWTARESKNANIYKKLVGDTLVGDQMLLVGYIKKNTTSGTAEGVDGNITIKAYLDKNKILISDTYDGTESDNMGTPNSMVQGKTVLTTTEWNALQTNGVSFKVKVEANEGIWVKGSLEEIMRQENFDTTKNRGILDNEQSTFVSASTGIDFGGISSDTNGKGVYMRAGTENDPYPILYYRGVVEDNNVILANKCWKAVRTTDTGGVKLIYNGLPANIYSNVPLDENEYTITRDDYGFTFDQNNKTFVATMPGGDYALGYFSLSVPNGNDYYAKIEIIGNIQDDSSHYYFDYNGDWPYEYVSSNQYEKIWRLGNLTSSDIVSFSDYLYDANDGPFTIKIQLLRPGDELIHANACDNVGDNTFINISGTNKFAFNESDAGGSVPTFAGYMYGTVYQISSSNWTSDAKFGSSFTWDGTNYKLVDATVTTPDATHHYSCNSTNTDATCNEMRYVYYVIGTSKYYITLTGGDGIEQAIRKMKANTTSSTAKTQIDTWYASNMTSVTSKLEDTIWCNDRSIGRYNGWSPTGIINGKDNFRNFGLLFGAFERSNFASDSSTVRNQPSLLCTSRDDAFTVSSRIGNRALTYPVAMLTSDEMVLAGGLYDENASPFYLSSVSGSYWSLSPSVFDYSVWGICMNGYDNGGDLMYKANGIRPAISIKPGQSISKGTGTVTDPYVIE